MSLHQFAHGGDLHLGPNARNEDRRRAFEQFVREGLALPHLAAWLLPGDLNHGRMTIDDRNWLAQQFEEMADRAPVVVCYGNHDLPGDLAIFQRLRTRHRIEVVERPQVLWIKTANGGDDTGGTLVRIFVLPYPTEAGLAAAGVAPGDIAARAQQALEWIFRDAAAQLAEARANGHLVIPLLGHVNVGGSVTEAGQPNIGHEIEIDPTMLALLGPGYKGLNHIHRGQEIGGAWYPGSFCRLDWAEISAKRWLLVEYADALTASRMDPRWRGSSAFAPAGDAWSYSVAAIPLDVAPMYHVEGRLTRDSFDWLVKDGPEGAPLKPPASWAGCEVRVRAKFNASERQIIDFARAQIFATFAGAKKLELELVAVPDREIRAPQVAAARSLADKVVAWAELEGVTVTDGLREKLAELEHGDPTVVLAALQQRLEALAQPEKATVAA